MKNWNNAEMIELSISRTEKNGNTGETDNKHYKTKTQQCEIGHSTNFAFCGDPEHDGYNNGYEGDETVTPDGLS